MRLSRDTLESLMETSGKRRVLRQLIKGGILTERRLAQYVGLAHVSVSDILEEFERFRLASSKKVGRANLWTLNKESYAFKAVAPFLEAFDRTVSPKEALKALIKKRLKNGIVQEAILFGSLVDGTERDESDIDLCVITRGPRRTQGAFEESLDALTGECYRLFGKRLSPYVLSSQEWERKQESRLGQQILKGEKVSRLYPSCGEKICGDKPR